MISIPIAARRAVVAGVAAVVLVRGGPALAAPGGPLPHLQANAPVRLEGDAGDIDALASLVADQLGVSCIVRDSARSPLAPDGAATSEQGVRTTPQHLQYVGMPLAAVLDDASARFGCAWRDVCGVCVFFPKPPTAAMAAGAAMVLAAVPPPTKDELVAAARAAEATGRTVVPVADLPPATQATIRRALDRHLARILAEGADMVRGSLNGVGEGTALTLNAYLDKGRVNFVRSQTGWRLLLWHPRTDGKPGLTAETWSSGQAPPLAIGVPLNGGTQ